jgi:hypothetical protein
MKTYTLLIPCLLAQSTSSLPIPQLLSADSLTIFTDHPDHYPQLHDALHSLCRQVAEEKRDYEMDVLYRTRELRNIVVGTRLDAVCGMLLMCLVVKSMANVNV